MTVTIYVATFLLILTIYHFFNQNTFSSKIILLLFFLLFSFCCFLYKPFFTLPFWAGLAILFYVALDDFLQKSFNVVPVIALYIYFNILNFSIINLLFSAAAFAVLFFLSRKEMIGEGEAYIIPLFFVIAGAESIFSFLYISTVLACLFFFIFYLFGHEEREHPFVPTLLLSSFVVITENNTFQVVFWLTVLFFIFYIIYFFRRRVSPLKK